MTGLSDEYARQRAWRSWPAVLDALPSLENATVLDLGCAIGDQAAELADRGARVIGIDGNAELLDVARSRGIVNAEFREADLRNLGEPDVRVDGIWCSFTAAYFPDLPTVLRDWSRWMKPGAWIALTEIDDFFGHEPVPVSAAAVLADYAVESLQSGRYDFHMGRKLSGHLASAGFAVTAAFTVADVEFSLDGTVDSDVHEAWQRRFDRMKLLRDFGGSEFETIRGAFLSALAQRDHRSKCRVHCCIAALPTAR